MAEPGGSLLGPSGNPSSASSVGAKARGGARWSVLTQVLVQVASAGATVILARILLPSDFGTVALAQSLMGAATLVSLGGITAAIITTVGDELPKAATYFWVALGVGVAFAGVLSALAPTLSAALGQGTAAPYVMLLTVTLPLTLTTLVPQALLQRRLQFSHANVVTLTGALVYFAIEIILAVSGWGAWAVIVGQVSGAAVSLATALILARWLPTRAPSLTHIREDLSLIANMGLGSFLTYLAKNADYWVVSRTMGGAALGIYYIAYVLPSIVRLRLSAVFRQVMLPIMFRIEDPAERGRAWGRALGIVLTIGFPTLFGIAAVADPLVRVFFGEQWRVAALPMQVITVASISDILFNAVATMAISQKRYILRTNVLVGLRAALIAVGASIAAPHWGLPGVAGALMVASLLSLAIQEFWISRPLGVGLSVIGTAPAKALALSILMTALVLIALRTVLVDLSAWTQLLASVPVGVVVYVGLSWLFARAELCDTVSQAGKMLRGR